MIPALALVGRPNVGKSTLFNLLTRSRNALVADFPGLTRDRLYGIGTHGKEEFAIIDTGGIGESEASLSEQVAQQTDQAINEADVILFLVDGRAGVTAGDIDIANKLRGNTKPVWLVVNKTDGLQADEAVADFYQLGFSNVYAISASHRKGIVQILNSVFKQLPDSLNSMVPIPSEFADSVKVAILGRPNVGKSTLFNRMLGEERAVVFDAPGTTRDSLYLPLERHGKKYLLIDTAGIRRKARVHETIEKFSAIKALQAMSLANVVILVIDGQLGLHKQELTLLSAIISAGRSLVIAVNKWDNLDTEKKEKIKEELRRRLGFLRFVRLYFISALHGTNVGHLFEAVDETYQSSMLQLSSNKMTDLLQAALQKTPPPLAGGRRIKPRYAHLGGHNPPIIVIHGTQVDKFPTAYVRYLTEFFREQLGLVGTPLRLEFKTSENPFAGKKNELTDRQRQKRKRLMKHVKKK